MPEFGGVVLVGGETMVEFSRPSQKVNAAGKGAVMAEPDVAQRRLEELDAKRRGRGKLAERKFPLGVVVGAVVGAVVAYIVAEGTAGREGAQLWLVTALGFAFGTAFWLITIMAGAFLIGVALLG